MNKIAPYAKAITGAAVAGLASAQQALADGTINSSESIGIAIATLTALALVWAIPNGDDQTGQADIEHEDDLTYEEMGGQAYEVDEVGGSDYPGAGDPSRS